MGTKSSKNSFNRDQYYEGDSGQIFGQKQPRKPTQRKEIEQFLDEELEILDEIGLHDFGVEEYAEHYDDKLNPYNV